MEVVFIFLQMPVQDERHVLFWERWNKMAGYVPFGNAGIKEKMFDFLEMSKQDERQVLFWECWNKMEDMSLLGMLDQKERWDAESQRKFFPFRECQNQLEDDFF